MIERDFVLRQVHQLVQALARVLGYRGADQVDLIETSVDDTLTEVFGASLDEVRRKSRGETREMCEVGGEFSPELAIALADLLREDESRHVMRRALWLYEDALDSGGTVPFDIFDRIEALRARVDDLTDD